MKERQKPLWPQQWTCVSDCAALRAVQGTDNHTQKLWSSPQAQLHQQVYFKAGTVFFMYLQSWLCHFLTGPNFAQGLLPCSSQLDQGPGYFITPSPSSPTRLVYSIVAPVVWVPSPTQAATVWNHTDATCTPGDWFQLQCITMGLHKKSLLQGDKNLIEFLKAEGWAFWIFPACVAWRRQIKNGICGDYSQMACNEWLSFPLMVTKQQSKKKKRARKKSTTTFGSDLRWSLCCLELAFFSVNLSTNLWLWWHCFKLESGMLPRVYELSSVRPETLYVK